MPTKTKKAPDRLKRPVDNSDFEVEQQLSNEVSGSSTSAVIVLASVGSHDAVGTDFTAIVPAEDGKKHTSVNEPNATTKRIITTTGVNRHKRKRRIKSPHIVIDVSETYPTANQQRLNNDSDAPHLEDVSAKRQRKDAGSDREAIEVIGTAQHQNYSQAFEVQIPVSPMVRTHDDYINNRATDSQCPSDVNGLTLGELSHKRSNKPSLINAFGTRKVVRSREEELALYNHVQASEPEGAEEIQNGLPKRKTKDYNAPEQQKPAAEVTETGDHQIVLGRIPEARVAPPSAGSRDVTSEHTNTHLQPEIENLTLIRPPTPAGEDRRQLEKMRKRSKNKLFREKLDVVERRKAEASHVDSMAERLNKTLGFQANVKVKNTTIRPENKTTKEITSRQGQRKSRYPVEDQEQEEQTTVETSTKKVARLHRSLEFFNEQLDLASNMITDILEANVEVRVRQKTFTAQSARQISKTLDNFVHKITQQDYGRGKKGRILSYLDEAVQKLDELKEQAELELKATKSCYSRAQKRVAFVERKSREISHVRSGSEPVQMKKVSIRMKSPDAESVGTSPAVERWKEELKKSLEEQERLLGVFWDSLRTGRKGNATRQRSSLEPLASPQLWASAASPNDQLNYPTAAQLISNHEGAYQVPENDDEYSYLAEDSDLPLPPDLDSHEFDNIYPRRELPPPIIIGNDAPAMRVSVPGFGERRSRTASQQPRKNIQHSPYASASPPDSVVLEDQGEWNDKELQALFCGVEKYHNRPDWANCIKKDPGIMKRGLLSRRDVAMIREKALQVAREFMESGFHYEQYWATLA